MALPIRFHALVPAAGVGARLGASVPKQYLELAGQSLLQWSVKALLDASFLDSLTVVVAPGDERAAAQLAGWPGVEVRAVGGASRRDSVLAGLDAVSGGWSDTDWVLVHDAARPGLSPLALELLRQVLADDPVGGLLALPVADTVKQSADGSGRVQATLARETLWLAQTPQMFRLGLLRDALRGHPGATDEASAIEAAGHRPRLVHGEAFNFKVTSQADWQLMSAWLAARQAAPPANPQES